MSGEIKQVPLRIKRWSQVQRWQHFGILCTFMLCAITGLPIKFNTSPLSFKVVQVFGGFDSMLTVHLASGLVMTLVCMWHLLWVAYRGFKYKKYAGWGVLPTKKDGRDIVQYLKYQLGLVEQPVRFDRYSYKEKFDYWAVFWGMFIIGGSGFIMWFPELGAAVMPRWMINAYRIGHSDEAVLAIIAIFVWHFYNVHFSPDFFPGSLTWFDGWIDREVMLHEHPLELARIDKEYSGNEKLWNTEGNYDVDSPLPGESFSKSCLDGLRMGEGK